MPMGLVRSGELRAVGSVPGTMAVCMGHTAFPALLTLTLDDRASYPPIPELLGHISVVAEAGLHTDRAYRVSPRGSVRIEGVVRLRLVRIRPRASVVDSVGWSSELQWRWRC